MTRKTRRDVIALLDADDIGAEIRKLREAAGMSRERVAVYMGRSVATLVRWETNQKVPTIVEARDFAEVLATGMPIPGTSKALIDLTLPTSDITEPGDMLADLRQAVAQMRERNRDMADTA